MGHRPAALRDEGEPERGGCQRRLEGARGLACLQVLLLHGFGAFLPALVEGTAEARGWMDLVRLPPLQLLYDDDTAVFIVFALSGHVLTGPLMRGAAHPSAMLAWRLACLLPLALAGTLMGWLLCPGFDDLRLQAAALVPAGWLNGNGIEAPMVAALQRDAGLTPLSSATRDQPRWRA